MRYLVRSLMGLGLIGLTAGGTAPLLAQTAKPGEPKVLRPGERVRESAFRLFGDRDYALGGFRFSGVYTGCTDNSSNLVTAGQCFWPFNTTNPQGAGNMPNWFDLLTYVAAGPTEWTKHQAEVPSLANAFGKGYTVNSGLGSITGEILPHDGTLGPFHKGAQSTEDGSCQDISTDIGPFITASGQPMLAASDCEPTWGSAGWQGTRNVDADGYLGYAAQVGDMNFSFDWWQVPEQFQRTDKFLGNFQTYGFFSDYSVETLFGSSVYPSYGNIIPESMGGDPAETPTRVGWPLGILVKQDAFSFTAPGLKNTAWYQLTVTNNSREVYGVGLDYDSLYMGLQAGWLTYEQGTSIYRDPANGVVRGATFCQTPGCGPGGDPMHPGDQWGSIPPNGVGEGFNYGAAAIIVLKSPIGDLRNKQFTDPTSPFFGKGDPSAWDDTITFNHGHMCGFHGCSRNLWNAAPEFSASSDFEQRQFGMVASVATDALGNRALGDASDHIMWDTFRWEEFPDRNQLDFNTWLPGNWDYNDDAVDDRLWYEDCTDNAGPQFDPFTGNSKNCSVSWSDSLPGGFGNVYANTGQVSGVGPFRLPADSTVGWVIAVVMSDDVTSTGIENDIAKAIDHYQAFYLGPEPAPSPAITSVEVHQGGENQGVDPVAQPQASITLYFDDTSEQWADPFLQKFLDDMLAAPPASELGRIRDLNPFLADTLAALIPNNVAAIHVFKSCDGGGTFTNGADCFADPAIGDGFFAELGWLPLATLEPDANGDFPNVFSDDGIFGGRSFLYSLVTETYGLSVPVQTGEVLDTLGVPPNEEVVCIQGCGSTTLDIAPRLAPVIGTSTGLPSVASVYIPIAQQSGYGAAEVTLVTGSPDFVPFSRMNVQPTTDDVQDGNYKMFFGDEAIVTEVATVAVTGTTIDNTTVQLIDGGTDTLTLTAAGPVGVEGSFSETVVGDQRTRVWTFSALTAVLTDGSDVPLTVTDDLTGGQTVPGRYFGLSNFPGLTFSIDNGLGGSFNEQFYLDAAGEQIPPQVEPSVTFLEGEASSVTGEGRYRITWTDKAYGAGSPFVINFFDPDGTRSAVVQSLEGRTAGQTATTDPDLASFLGLPAEALLPVRLPFRIENITDPDNPTPVDVVITNDAKITEIMLGDQLDTLFVTVPETEWVPGDELMLVEGSAPAFNVTFGTAVVGCFPPTWRRTTCNPVGLSSRGATGYIPNGADQELHYSYYQTIGSTTEYVFAVSSAVRGDALVSNDPDAIRAELEKVKVVPNPFVMFSRFSTDGNVDRLIFTHVPPRGLLRVFTVAGQFVQQVRWTPEDLNGRGDLWFNLRTREGLEMAAGLYLYVLTATDDNGREIGTAKGKFVLIK